MKPSASWGRKDLDVIPDSPRSTVDPILPGCLRRIPMRAPTSSHPCLSCLITSTPVQRKRGSTNSFGCLPYSGIFEDFSFSPQTYVTAWGTAQNQRAWLSIISIAGAPQNTSFVSLLKPYSLIMPQTSHQEEVGCSVLNYSPSKMRHVLSSKYFKLKNTCKQRASVNKAAQ